MQQVFTIPGRFCSLNEFYRMHYQQQGHTKKEYDEIVMYSAHGLKPYDKAVTLSCKWYEPNKRRDLDNVFFGVKFIQDGLVKAGILANDTSKEIAGISHEVAYDKENPRIVVTITEAEKIKLVGDKTTCDTCEYCEWHNEDVALCVYELPYLVDYWKNIGACKYYQAEIKEMERW